jgi:DNA-binding transcriptional ArsR family regulator
MSVRVTFSPTSGGFVTRATATREERSGGLVRQSSNLLSVTVLEQPEIEAVELADVLQALSDPARLEIVRALAAEGERQCGTFDLGLTKATRSHHFKVLRAAGVTDTRIEGTARFVSLRRDELEARFPGLLDAVTR